MFLAAIPGITLTPTLPLLPPPPPDPELLRISRAAVDPMTWKYGSPRGVPIPGFVWERRHVGTRSEQYRLGPELPIKSATAAVITPMVQEGIITEEEIGPATSVIEKIATAKPGAVVLTPKERELLEEKMGPALKEKKSPLRWILPVGIGLRLWTMYA